MCAKPEPTLFLRPIAELVEELQKYDHHNPLRDFAWAGVSVFYGVLENA